MFSTSHIRTLDADADAANFARDYMGARYCENVDAVALVSAVEYTEAEGWDGPRRTLIVEIRDTSSYLTGRGHATDVGTALADFLAADRRGGYFRDLHVVDVIDRDTP